MYLRLITVKNREIMFRNFSQLILSLVLILSANESVCQDNKNEISGISRQELNVLPYTINGTKKAEQLTYYLNNRIKKEWLSWKERFEEEDFVDNYQQHAEELKSYLISSIGKFPERTPLNSKVVDVVDKLGYRVEKIIFESRPHHYVTATMFVPDSEKFLPPYPGVLIPCGHYEPAKAHDEYQSMGALCALNGMAALVFDPIDQGERIQLTDTSGKTKLWGTRAHNLNGIKAILLGENIAQYFIWDGIRAIDYLSGRYDINPDLLGITGNSGGATQASYLFFIDERLKVSAPSCYIHNLSAQAENALGDAEQNIFGQVIHGLDHPDYLMARAPAPIKLLTATHDFFKPEAVWETFRFVKRYYTSLGFSEKADIMENNAGHNYNKIQREGAVRWLSRWLLNDDKPITEPDLELITPEDMRCTPTGNVKDIDGAISVHDIFLSHQLKLESDRKKFLKNDLAIIKEKLKELLSVTDLDKLNPLETKQVDVIEEDFYSVEKLIITNSQGLKLPALKFVPKQNISQNHVLFISEYGKYFHLEEIKKLVKQGNVVLAVDLLGTGEVKQEGKDGFRLSRNMNWEDSFKTYLLGESVVGMRVKDIIQCAEYLIHSTNIKNVDMIAYGEVGVPALHAAFLKTELFTQIKLVNTLASWVDVIENKKSFNQLTNVVNGALKYYDLPDLVSLLEGKVEIKDPFDASGVICGKDPVDIKLSEEPKYPGLAGILYGRINFTNPEYPDPLEDLNCEWNNKIQRRGRDWAAKWFGSIISPFDGEVEINVSSNQSVEIELGDLLKENLGYNTEKKSYRIKLVKGKLYPFRISFSQDGVDLSYMKVTWNKVGEKEEVISSEYLRFSPKEKFKMENDWK